MNRKNEEINKRIISISENLIYELNCKESKHNFCHTLLELVEKKTDSILEVLESIIKLSEINRLENNFNSYYGQKNK